MLRRCTWLRQFRMGHYTGPLPAVPAPSSSSSASDATPASVGSAALRVAESIAGRVKRENAAEHLARQKLQDMRRGNEEAFLAGGHRRRKPPRWQQQEDENENENENENEDEDDDEHEQQQQQQLTGDHNRRLASEIPTLAAPVAPDAWVFQPRVLDANRRPTQLLSLFSPSSSSSSSSSSSLNTNPTTTTAPTTTATSDFSDIDALLHPAIAQSFAAQRPAWNLRAPTPTQSLALHATVAERRDVCVIAPTGTGKTLCYALPALHAALAFHGVAADASPAMARAQLAAREAERSAGEHAEAAERAAECRYCGLNTREQRICPQTGAPHPPPPQPLAAGAGASPKELADAQLRNNSNNDGSSRKTNMCEPAALILCPTGVLVDQVHRVMRSLHCGLRIACVRHVKDDVSMDAKYKMRAALCGADVVVGTIASVLVELNHKSMSLRNVRFFAIDEIDAAMEVPVFDNLAMILSRMPSPHKARRGDARQVYYRARNRSSNNSRHASPSFPMSSDLAKPQCVLVGATLPPALMPQVGKLMDPDRARWVIASVETPAIPAGAAAAAANSGDTNALPPPPPPATDMFGGISVASNITHSILMVSDLEKTDKLKWLYDTGRLSGAQQTIIFCNSRANVKFLATALPQQLAHHNLRIATLHPSASDDARDAIWRRFQSGALQVLVTTDVFARGIDFDNAAAVVQFDFPHRFELFLHRAGRCGRRGRAGHNFAFFEPQDARHAKRLVALLNRRRQDVPPALLAYARQAWSDFYREQVAGTSLRRFKRSNPDVHKHPLGLPVRRFVGERGRDTARLQSSKHRLPQDFRRSW